MQVFLFVITILYDVILFKKYPVLMKYTIKKIFCHFKYRYLLFLLTSSPFRHSRQTGKHKSRILCLIFGESRFPGNSQIPDPVNTFIIFPIPAPYFGQIPNPAYTLPDPVLHNYVSPWQQALMIHVKTSTISLSMQTIPNKLHSYITQLNILFKSINDSFLIHSRILIKFYSLEG